MVSEREATMGFKDSDILLSVSPILIIDDIEAVIVHLDKISTKTCEHMDVQIPGFHVLNRIGFHGDGRRVLSYIRRHLGLIWEPADHNTDAYHAG